MDKKHLLVIEVDDELPDIYEKLKATKEKKIHLFVPRNAILLHSLVNLKILKRKADELSKEITIVTKDKKNLNLIQSLGFLTEEEKNISEVIPANKEPKKGKERKNSIWQMLRQKVDKNGSNPPQGPYVFSRPSRQPLITFLLVSILVFFGILYIALPSATVYIKPKLSTTPSSLNIQFVSKDRIGKIVSEDDRIVALYPITIEYERTVKMAPTGRVFTGGNATGQITLYNKSKDPWPIVANSRLQTADGLVFTTKNFTTVPGGSATAPGQIVIEVIAREKDANGLFTGFRGNIEPTKFFLPGLSTYNQTLLTGQSTQAFTGGSDSFEYFTTKSDLSIAKQKIASELEVTAMAELNKAVLEKNKSNGDAFMLFDRTDKLLQKEQLALEVRTKENDNSSSFDAWGKMRVSGYYFNSQDLEKILLRNLTKNHLGPTEKILKVQDHSLQIDEVLEVKADIPEVKVNASLKGIVAYDFYGNTSDLIKQIKETVIGKNKKEAESYINNLKEIEEANISVWPIWSPTLPTIAENIKIQIQE